MERVIAIKVRDDLIFYVVASGKQTVELLGLVELRSFLHNESIEEALAWLTEFYEKVAASIVAMQTVTVDVEYGHALDQIVVGSLEPGATNVIYNHAEAVLDRLTTQYQKT